jgi:Lrp/AsnC family transcriptional regulator, leucine-responsive regulatory protein
MDGKDAEILNILQKNSRTSNAEIARQINMAPSAVLERIRRLEEKKIIKKYTVQVNPADVERDLLAFVHVRATGPVVDQKTAKQLAKVPEVQEVHLVAGEDCFLIKVRVKNTEELSKLLRTKIAVIPSIRSTSTTIVLETVKEENELVISA